MLPQGIRNVLCFSDIACSLTFDASPFVLAAAIYLALLSPVVRLVSQLKHTISR
jgi:polar amino acid transport system permease protein